MERERQTAAKLDRLKAELTAIKQTNTKVPDPHNYNETNTRKYPIDVLIREMGWDLTHPDSIEYPVEGMPTSVWISNGSSCANSPTRSNYGA